MKPLFLVILAAAAITFLAGAAEAGPSKAWVKNQVAKQIKKDNVRVDRPAERAQKENLQDDMLDARLDVVEGFEAVERKLETMDLYIERLWDSISDLSSHADVTQRRVRIYESVVHDIPGGSRQYISEVTAKCPVGYAIAFFNVTPDAQNLRRLDPQYSFKESTLLPDNDTPAKLLSVVVVDSKAGGSPETVWRFVHDVEIWCDLIHDGD